MVFLTLSKKLNQFLGPFLLRQGVKLRYTMANKGGIMTDNPTMDAFCLIPLAQRLIELEVYHEMKQQQHANKTSSNNNTVDTQKQHLLRVAILESYVRPALCPHEQWSDIQQWQFHVRILKWLRTQYLLARHPVPSPLPAILKQSPQLSKNTAATTETVRLPSTAAVTRFFGMTEWSVQKNTQRQQSMEQAIRRLNKRNNNSKARLVSLRGGAVCLTHVDDNDLSTDHVSLQDLIELAGCHVTPCGPFNTLCEELELYQLWTKEYVERLGHYLWRQHSQKQELLILDVGAGDGLLAQLLREQLALSTGTTTTSTIQVIASDDKSWSIAERAPVEPLSVQETLDKYCSNSDNTHVIVLCSWMPLHQDWTKLFRQAGVEEYILIGECDDGQCGDNWETWGNYASLSVEEEHETDAPPPLAPYQVDGYKRTELSSLAPYQLSRFDTAGSKAGRTISFRKTTSDS